MHNYPGNSTTTAMVASASQAATVTSANFDLQTYEGFALLVQNKGTGTGTLDGKLQHSDDGSTGWTDTGLAFTQAGTGAGVQALSFDTKSLKRFVRYVGTIATGPHLLGVTLTATKKYA
jgi:hypothetical protein